MPGSVTGTTQHPTSRHFARDQSTGHQLRFQAMRIRGLEKESSIGGWFAFLLMVGIVTLAGCVQPKVPWRVVVCEGKRFDDFSLILRDKDVMIVWCSQ